MDGNARELQGEIAFVTGATRGIGRAIALELGRAGATVVGTATTDEGAARIEASLREAGIAGEGRRLEATDAAAADALVHDIAARLGPVTILVNNAGITRDGLMLRMKDADWDATLAINVTAAFRLSRAVLRGMLKLRRGRIIQIGSVVGSAGNAGQANYAASKAALAGFTRSLALEVAGRNVTVNVVAPGLIDTDMTQALGEEQREAMLARVPLARFGTPEDVAHAVAFLAGPRGAYITGTTLHVNGGMLMC
ncbi:MAG: 3-oxoacyl-ACP reductase FabG [Proteobacteria bacterium]|jgi:3-oxoacyl-[acyl-carrier protein] reductase|nr:3-oxoacyl-ACP reductase FabG [Pseudomonadota bacterium]